MSRRPQLALVLLPLVIGPPITIAQAPSAPGAHERELAQIIRQAGYDCREVERIEVKVSPDPSFDSLRPEVAICKNGKKFLVMFVGTSRVARFIHLAPPLLRGFFSFADSLGNRSAV
jgi:hypothetical protein